MNEGKESERLQAKTPEHRFLRVMETDFHYGPKIAEAILYEAEECLVGRGEGLRVGQMRVVLVKREARHGQAMRETATTEVTWTIDDGVEDQQVQQRDGGQALRRVRIQRLLDEALEQGAVATQEDLARVLHTSVRTIKRDFAELAGQGIDLLGRGKLKGIGRGQSHKAQIIRRWLRGESYDQLVLSTHHSASSIQRYVQAFTQVVSLHRQDFAAEEIGLLLQIGQPLVRDYLNVYAQNDQPACRERLEGQLQRLGRASRVEKGAK